MRNLLNRNEVNNDIAIIRETGGQNYTILPYKIRYTIRGKIKKKYERITSNQCVVDLFMFY